MRILLVSSGQVAVQFARELCTDHDVTIVQEGPEGGTEIDRLDVEVLEGPGNDPALLKRAGAAEADFVVACTRSDEMNIIACITARKMGSAKTFCFVTGESYVRTFASGDGSGHEGAPDLGIDSLVWPAQMLANRIERILSVPGATDVGLFARGRIALLEYRIAPGIPLVDRPLMEIRSLPPGVLIVAVTRGEEWFVPRGQSVLAEGDRVLFMGRADAMRRLSEWFTEHLGEEESGDIVIIGGGTVAFQLAKSIERTGGSHVKLIEKDQARCKKIESSLRRTLVLHGDGSDLDLLESERVRYARALIAVTDRDEKNLLCSLLGKQLGIPKIITRVSSEANRRLFERVGIDVPLSTRGTATEAVLHMIRHREVDLLATLGEGKGEVLELSLPEDFTPRPLKEIALPPDSIVASIIRRDEALVPGGATMVGPGDRCLVICKTERVAQVHEALTA